MPDIVGAAVAVGFLVLWIYCIYDSVTTDEAIVRYLPKLAWVLIVFLVPDIGSILWLAFGRPRVWARNAHQGYGPPPPSFDPSNPLDDPRLERMDPIVRHREEQARLRMWEAQLKRREEAIKRRLTGEADEGEHEAT